ncbi:MAG: NrdH-redoxin [SAR86 cluster bacterium]|uniref:NrdH-redoxin n=1 Tax=SAR86 cluster bacterium TaxID=2030880 RepID=A0A2A4WSF7_9GAMM|nr:MAG: NrdH-redoxin [SAR86 cluster bacterium]
MNRLIFYTTVGCHLCEHAAIVLQEFAAQSEAPPFDLDEVDISTDEYLVELYGIRIPVVKNSANEKEIGWPFGLEDLSTLF